MTINAIPLQFQQKNTEMEMSLVMYGSGSEKIPKIPYSYNHPQ